MKARDCESNSIVEKAVRTKTRVGPSHLITCIIKTRYFLSDKKLATRKLHLQNLSP